MHRFFFAVLVFCTLISTSFGHSLRWCSAALHIVNFQEFRTDGSIGIDRQVTLRMVVNVRTRAINYLTHLENGKLLLHINGKEVMSILMDESSFLFELDDDGSVTVDVKLGRDLVWWSYLKKYTVRMSVLLKNKNVACESMLTVYPAVLRREFGRIKKRTYSDDVMFTRREIQSMVHAVDRLESTKNGKIMNRQKVSQQTTESELLATLIELKSRLQSLQDIYQIPMFRKTPVTDDQLLYFAYGSENCPRRSVLNYCCGVATLPLALTVLCAMIPYSYLTAPRLNDRLFTAMYLRPGSSWSLE